MPYIESQMEFESRQGNPESQFLRGRFVYKNASCWFPTSPNSGYGQNPPTDPEDLKSVLFEFYSAKLDAASEKIASNEQCVVTQNSLAERYSNMSTADQRFGDWRSNLKQLRKEVKALQAEVNKYKPVRMPTVGELNRIQTLANIEQAKNDLRKFDPLNLIKGR
jgi:hypothetical protein